eukprot:3539644-Rhodomonas_salina.5
MGGPAAHCIRYHAYSTATRCPVLTEAWGMPICYAMSEPENASFGAQGSCLWRSTQRTMRRTACWLRPRSASIRAGAAAIYGAVGAVYGAL